LPPSVRHTTVLRLVLSRLLGEYGDLTDVHQRTDGGRDAGSDANVHVRDRDVSDGDVY
jgi:hypothetical protein